MKRLVTLFKEVLIPSITVITAAMVAYLNFSVSKVESELKRREQEMREREEQRIERESLQAFNLKIYEAVTQSLQSANPKQQEVARALVIVMADDPLRTSLLNILKESGLTDQTVRKQVEDVLEREQKFRSEEESIKEITLTSSSTSDWKDWNYDIFWGEKSGESAKKQAEVMVGALKTQGAKGRLRVRRLPESINLRPGYQLRGYVIRHNLGEEKQANTIKKIGDQALSNYGAKFDITISQQATPLYISVFICP
jgi:hypothetical protein